MFRGSKILPTQPYLKAQSHVISDVRDAFAMRNGRSSNYCTYSSTSRSISDLLMQKGIQKHFLWTMVGPDSSYSPFEIHICWKVLKDDKIEPPMHTEYFRSGGATTLIFIVDGANAVSSFVMRSPMP